MKKNITQFNVLLWLFVLFIGTHNAQSQTVTDPSDEPGYDSLKITQVNNEAIIFMENHPESLINYNSEVDNNSTRSGGCFIPVDGSFTAIPRNDDGSYGPINLPFNFNLYGTNYTQAYINTNGNITFTGPLSWFSSSGFPFNIPMVAPFWGDVDTRNGGLIYFKLTSTSLIVTWNNVGYYSYQSSRPNTFQAILTNSNDPLIGIGNNVAFYYEDMRWTTGNASGGSGGFGGTPATVGVNKGTGSNYVQVGRFNQNNYSYDGPGGAHDGVNYLDNKCFTFNISNATNQPPSVSGVPPGSVINLACGETQTINLSFIGPEVAQTVTTTINTGGLCNTTTSVSNGAVSVATATITGTSCNEGSHVISFTATDNFNIPASTTVNITVNVESCCTIPVLTCPTDVSLNNAPGQCGANVTYPAATASGSPNPSITYSHPSGSYFPVGITEVTVTAENSCGTTSCTFDVEVVDTEIPNISCPFNITVNTDPNVCGAIVTYNTPSATDNCGTGAPPTSLAGYTYKGTHEGHSYFISNNLVRPEDAHANAIALGGHLVTISDYAENQFVSSFNSGRIWIGLTDRDVEGNWGWVTSEPLNYTNWAGGEPNNWGGNEDWAVINWSGSNPNWNDWFYTSLAYYAVEFDGGTLPAQLVDGLASGSVFPVGDNVVTYEVTDPSGNSVECSFIVTVVDNMAPVISVTSGSNNTSEDGIADCTYTGYAINGGGFYTVESDNCSSTFTVVEEEYFDGNLVSTYTWTIGLGGSHPWRVWPVGVTTMVVTISDESGNSSTDTYTQTVYDDEFPTVLTQDVSIYLNATGQASITVEMIDNGSFDNCEMATLVLDNLNFDCGNVGANTVVLTATDIYGNVNSALATVTVIDEVAPIALCQDVNVTLSGGSVSITPEMVDNGSNDACGIASLDLDITSFDCSNIGDNPVVLTVTDNNGNVSTCNAMVSVMGVIPTCEIDVELENDTYTGGDGLTIFMGYGPQALTAHVLAEGGGPFTYSWTGGNGFLSSTTSSDPVFTPTAEGMYTLVCTVTNSYGCETICEVEICVMDIRAGGNGNNAKVYLCHVPNGDLNKAKTLKVSVNAVPGHLNNHDEDHLGRCDQECGSFKVDFVDEVFTEIHEPTLNVYPNPTLSLFNFTLESPSDDIFSLEVYDHLGRKMMELDEQLPNETIEFGDDLPVGFYYINVVQGEFVQTLKIIKTH